MNSILRTAAVLSASTLAIATASAQKAPTAPPLAAEHQEEIIITAVPLSRSREDVIGGVSVLAGPELVRSLKSTVAETLAHTPGVSASSFGPSASRPILRGFQGARIRVLSDGVGSFDASNASADHAVVINPLLAQSIEVVRGPSALLYGSEAIGGVVNVVDTRIPRSVPVNGFRLSGTGTYGSAADERSGGAAADVAVGEHLVLHADGSYLKSNDLRIGGFALTPARRAEALATAAAGGDPDGDVDFAANAAVKNRLPNTAAKTWDAAVGATLITDRGSFGIAYTHYDSLYGVPIRFATALGEEAEAPRIDVRQDRIDARAEIDAGGPLLDTIRLRLGAADYRHYELEEGGEIGTTFTSQGGEARLELVQTKRGAWSGITGGQFLFRDFDVVGEESFLPRNQSESGGIFTQQQLDFGSWKVEGGARVERSSARTNPRADQPQFALADRRFTAFSGSLGASAKLTEGLRFGINLSHTERAPSAEELFANGPHAGTEAFEIGDLTLRKERAEGAEAVLHAHAGRFDLEASAFYNRFSNYIDQFQTGDIEDGLPVYQVLQGKARYWGFEVQARATLAKIGGFDVDADALADYVRATVVDNGPAPRIPPLRMLGGLEAHSERLFGRAEVERVTRQDRVSGVETPTPGYTMVNASIGYTLPGPSKVQISLSANNIFDVTARRAASFLKDYAPLAGRDIRLTARFAI